MTNNGDLIALNVNDEFKHGFNAGYLLAQQAPQEVKSLKSQKNKSDFNLGFIAGEKRIYHRKDQS